MKRFGLFFLSMLLSAFFLTSCLEGGGSVSEGVFACLLDYDYSKGFNPVFRSSYGYFSAPNLDNLILQGEMNPGDCYSIYYRYDDKLPENAPNVINMNGYFTISILGYAKVSKYHLSYYLTDISTILTSEIPIQKVDILDCLPDHLFMVQESNHASEWELDWDISYDSEATMPVVENGKRYYDIYLRAKVRKETQQTAKSNVEHLVAYNMGSYLRNVASMEQTHLGSSYSASSSMFTLRFHYVTGLNEAENSMTWQSETKDVLIALVTGN